MWTLARWSFLGDKFARCIHKWKLARQHCPVKLISYGHCRKISEQFIAFTQSPSSNLQIWIPAVLWVVGRYSQLTSHFSWRFGLPVPGSVTVHDLLMCRWAKQWLFRRNKAGNIDVLINSSCLIKGNITPDTGGLQHVYTCRSMTYSIQTHSSSCMLFKFAIMDQLNFQQIRQTRIHVCSASHWQMCVLSVIQ